MQCVVDPCQNATCSSDSRAVCVADYCLGCNARWFVGFEEVTDMCTTGVPFESSRSSAIACSAGVYLGHK